jgi:hypothetical protein
MSLTFRSLFLFFFGFILLQAKGLSPGNADVLVGLNLPRHISCRRGRQRSQANKVAEPSRLRRARCPRSCQGSKGRERGRPARMKEEGHCCPSPCCRYEKLVTLGEDAYAPGMRSAAQAKPIRPAVATNRRWVAFALQGLDSLSCELD